MGFLPRTDSRRCPYCGSEQIRPVIDREYRGAVPLLPGKTEAMVCRRCRRQFFLVGDQDDGPTTSS